MEKQTNLIELIKLLLTEKKKIIIFTFSCALLGVLISFLLPVKYESESNFYVASAERLDPKTIFNKEVKVPLFGTSEDLDRFLLIASSYDLKNEIIKKNNLYNYWEIDTTTNIEKEKVYEEYDDYIDILKDRSGSLIIRVKDKDPEHAAILANEIMYNLEYVNRIRIINNLRADLKVYKKSISRLENDVVSTKDSIQILLSKYNISSSTNNKDGSMIFTANSVEGNKQLPTISVLSSKLEALNEQYTNIQSLYSTTKEILDAPMNTIFVIQKAIPVYKKASPIRWIVTIVSTLLGALIIVGYVLINNFYKKIL